MDILEELIHIKNNKEIDLYNYISNNYYKLSKEELKEIILNLYYAIYTLDNNKLKDIEKLAIDETIERLDI